MKKVFNITILTIFLVGSINTNATSFFQDDPFQECLWEAEDDYAITGSLESAIEVYNDCVEATLEELENIIGD